MKKYQIIIFGLLAIIFIWGCSDDENPLAPTRQIGVLDGYMFISENQLQCSGLIYSIDGSRLHIDSITVDGFKLEVNLYEHVCSYTVGKNTLNMYNSGDTALLEVFTPDGTSSVEVVLMEQEIDLPYVQNWNHGEPYDTIPTQNEFHFIWEAVDKADFYKLSLHYYYDSAGIWINRDFDTTFTDTVYSFSSDEFSYNGSLSVHVSSCTGPTVDEGGNLKGVVVKGKVISFAQDYLYFYIGTGLGY